jgi:hypothetical protein
MELKQNWEDVFPDAILSVEELLASGNPAFSKKSKLCLAIENNFLSWDDYKKWAQVQFSFPALNEIDFEKTQELRKLFIETAEGYSQYPIWNSELIPLKRWDGQVIILGLEYREEIKSVPQAIFIYCSPKILSAIRGDIKSFTQVGEDVLDIQENTPSKSLSFSELLIKEEKSEPTTQVWNTLRDKHEDFSMIARKKFDAYIVLKVTPDMKTELYKMDEDLEKEELNKSVFSYNLKEDNPFQNVYNNHFTETFNINQLGLKILDFKYACISAIKLGPKVVGFIVGFKTTHLSQDDITTLESITEKAV